MIQKLYQYCMVCAEPPSYHDIVWSNYSTELTNRFSNYYYYYYYYYYYFGFLDLDRDSWPLAVTVTVTSRH